MKFINLLNKRYQAVLFILLILAGLFIISCKKENNIIIKNPESVVWNPINKSYLISNTATGYILKLKDMRALNLFNQDKLKSPRGLAVKGQVCYVADGNEVIGLDLVYGKQVSKYIIKDAILLNDIATTPGNLIFASDTKKHSIVLIDTQSGKSHMFFHKLLQSPNGLYYETQDSTAWLYIVSFRDKAPIQKLNLFNQELLEIPNTQVSLADGITKDNLGNWLVSSWADSCVYVFDKDFKTRKRMDDTYRTPADIYYNFALEELAIPLFDKHIVNLVAKIDSTLFKK